MKIFITAIVVLSLAELPEIHAKIRIIQKSFSQSNDNSSYDQFLFGDELLTKVTWNGEKTVNCKIEQWSIPDGNVTHSCEVELKETPKDARAILFKIFGKDKLLIIEPLNGAVMFFTVHLDDCRMTSLRLPETFEEISQTPAFTVPGIGMQLFGDRKIVTYKDTYDIFYRDPKLSYEKDCKMTIDAEGRIVAGPVVFGDLSGHRFVNSVADHSPDKGLVYDKTVWTDERLHYVYGSTLVLVKPDGTEKSFAAFPAGIVKIFTNNNLIGACFYKLNDNNTCVQSDDMGHIKFQVVFEPKLNPWFLYSLEEGGLLLFIVETTANYQVTDLYLLKVNAAGEKIGKIDFERCDYQTGLKGYPHLHLWENEKNNEYCAAILQEYLEDGKLGRNFLMKCFSDNDFL